MATTVRRAVCTTAFVLVGALIANHAWGEDWPAFRRDSQRSAVTPESLSFPLSAGWSFQPKHEPRRAWPRNFRENPYANEKIRTLLTYDHAFHAVAAGGAVFLGSSADHKIYCLDAATGRPRWEYFTEGPIRCAPTVWEGKVYTGSDDGWLYCLGAASGDLLWKHRAGPTDERLPGNEQIISRWPIRSGVVVEDGVAYCAAGLFPHREGCFLSAVDATMGRPVWTEKIDQVSQGYLLASQQRLCVPAGKMPPQIYNRASGKLLHRIASPAGTFALINDDVLFAGPGLKGGEVGAVDTDHSNERLASFPGNQLIVAGDSFYLLTDNQLRAVSRFPFLQKRLESKQTKLQESLQADPDRSESVARRSQLTEIEDQLQRVQDSQDDQREWVHDSDCPHAMVLAGETLILGGDNKVRAVNAIDGETVWQTEVEGQALGLAVANGRLLVSTDRGDVHCFVSRDNESAAADGQELEAEITQALPETDHAERAANILAVAPSRKGYCLLLHSEGPGLAAEIAKNSELTVVQIEPNAKVAVATRRQLDAMGVYGPRVVVHHTAAPQLPYPDYLFNLVVVDRLGESDSSPTPEEVTRLLRPFGVAVVASAPSQASERAESRLRAWVGKTELTDVTMTDEGLTAVLRRGELPGSGQWTHQYGDPGNTACSEDRLIRRPLRLQWFGRPGPYRMFDRHAYTASPVYCYGRLFTLGERILYGNDAYNGNVLWSVELPELEPRVNLPRDCGFMAADEESVFVAAGDQCLRIDAESGQKLPAFTLPPTENEHEYLWGYVALQDDLLFGSGVRKGAFYDDGRGPWYDDYAMGEPQFSLKVLSDFLFVASREDKNLKWRYDGVVINSTITLGGGRIYFVENRNPQVLADASRRLAGGDTWKQLVIVALDATSGERVWEKEVEYESRTPVFFLGYKDETLVVMRSSGLFQLGALDASTGDLLWEKQHGWEQEHHGGHRRHPVLIKDVVYQQPQAYDLKTGEVKWSTNHFGGNCGTISACNSMLFSRLSDYPGLIDLNDGASTENLVEVTRPGCWINIIPAGGMILVPEAGSGCSCAYPLHASMAFLPQQ